MRTSCLAESMNSSVSILSSATLTGAANLADDQEEHEEEEGSDVGTPLLKTPHSLSLSSEDPGPREDRAGTIHSDMSGSCSTLQNDRPGEGEMESSMEQVKKLQMSVVFRQELLSVSQVKTESRIGLEVAKLADPNFDLVQMLGRSLPHVVPNVNLSKREVGFRGFRRVGVVKV